MAHSQSLSGHHKDCPAHYCPPLPSSTSTKIHCSWFSSPAYVAHMTARIVMRRCCKKLSYGPIPMRCKQHSNIRHRYPHTHWNGLCRRFINQIRPLNLQAMSVLCTFRFTCSVSRNCKMGNILLPDHALREYLFLDMAVTLDAVSVSDASCSMSWWFVVWRKWILAVHICQVLGG